MIDTAVEEAEANYFAMCLLMPRRFVEAEIKKMGGIDIDDDKSMRVLARKFGVSVTIMALRIGQLQGIRK